ncbi:MAG: 2-amino-4-hydroxy-6-hydroxymethyldihydropteridine diphosphokinase [Anaerolineae bacterium]
MAEIYLGLGSNLGDREANLRQALKKLEPRVQLRKVSSIYETEPVGFKEQPHFLNIACQGETDLPPENLLRLLKKIEQGMGRQTTIRWGPRTIDLDILFYDDLVLTTPDLTIPHPRLPERAFVLVPLAEIAPELVHPVLGLTVRQLLERVKAGKTAESRWDSTGEVQLWTKSSSTG